MFTSVMFWKVGLFTVLQLFLLSHLLTFICQYSLACSLTSSHTFCTAFNTLADHKEQLSLCDMSSCLTESFSHHQNMPQYGNVSQNFMEKLCALKYR